MTNADATALSDAQIHALRSRAQREAGPFVDPARLRHIQTWWNSELNEWASVISGHAVTSLRSLPWWQWVLLDLAHDAEPCPSPPPELTARRTEQRTTDQHRADTEHAAWEAEATEWAALRRALPVTTSVAFNFSRHTYASHVHGGYHLVTWDDLCIGRLRRSAGQAFCETPSRSQTLHLDSAGRERQAQEHGREHPMPTCKACLRTAYGITGSPPSSRLLDGTKQSGQR